MVKTLSMQDVSTPMVAACLGTAATAAASYLLYQKMACHQKQPFEDAGAVKRIFIYPIKSLPPVEVKKADFTLHGLRHKDCLDREFMIIEDTLEKKFITAREEPTFLLINVSYNEQKRCLELTSRNPATPMEPLSVPLLPLENGDESKFIKVSTWQDTTKYNAFPIDKASAWFSKYLGRQVKLVRLVALTGNRQKDVPDRFQDAAGVNFLSEKSVDNVVDLVSSPSENITYRNFRPSILVDTKYPFEEDFWSVTKIGNTETEFLQRCDRCVFTTINPDTAVKTNKEPLATLRKFRVDRSADGIAKYKFRPLLSSHHVVKKTGSIEVGQRIFAQKAPRDLL